MPFRAFTTCWQCASPLQHQHTAALFQPHGGIITSSQPPRCGWLAEGQCAEGTHGQAFAARQEPYLEALADAGGGAGVTEDMAAPQAASQASSTVASRRESRGVEMPATPGQASAAETPHTSYSASPRPAVVPKPGAAPRAGAAPKAGKGAAGGRRAAADCAVSLRFLLEFAETVPPHFSTADVVDTIIRPPTRKNKCRWGNPDGDGSSRLCQRQRPCRPSTLRLRACTDMRTCAPHTPPRVDKACSVCQAPGLTWATLRNSTPALRWARERAAQAGCCRPCAASGQSSLHSSNRSVGVRAGSLHRTLAVRGTPPCS